MATAERDRTIPNREAWSYEEAFARHEGLLTPEEQQKLRSSRVAIIGMGGVGGVHLITLARLGIGAFTIADPDVFELANFNRQYGANLRTLGRPKVEVMAEEALAINPELDIRTFQEPISEKNVGEFLDGADILVDGVDFFAMKARRLVFAEARRRGLWGVTAGPHAFGTGWLTFSPKGMSFDEYFDINDAMSEDEQIVAFAIGGTPSPLHLKYLNLSKFFAPGARKAGSAGIGCHLASGIVGTEVARLLLGWPGARPAPCYAQFDARRYRLKKGRLWGANRHPWQLAKRWWLQRMMRKNADRAVPRAVQSKLETV